MSPAAPVHSIARPLSGEHLESYARYIALVPGDDAGEALATQLRDTLALLRPLDEAGAARRYAPGKWSVREVVGHVMDAERVFAYRALTFARGDRSALPGFDEELWTPAGEFDRRPLSLLLDDFEALRASTVRLYRSFTPEALVRTGRANDAVVSVRALAWITAGHELHHRRVIAERYLGA